MSVHQITAAGITASHSEVVAAARERGEVRGADYSRRNAPTSPLASLTGNSAPERSILEWLRGRNKCNQFVGDVLTKVGLAMPTYTMPDGSKHFMHAEALPQQRNFFALRRTPNEIAAGDIIVIDGPGSGPNTAHVEIVTGFNSSSGYRLSTIGAIDSGVAERDRSTLLQGATWKSNGGAGGYFQKGGFRTYLLRPIAVLMAKGL